MNTISASIKSARILVAAAVLSLVGSVVAAPVADPQLEKAIGQGKDTFTHNTFNGNGRVCQTCHLSGGLAPGRLPDGKAIPSLANAAAVFPLFKPRQGKVVTLPDQIRNCVEGALEGKAPAYGSDELNALVVYVTSLSQGKTIDMGGKPQ
ncbi:MAG: cytochrome C [Ferrovum sp.]|nr:cytochrome C [Ferrovum sp.]